MSEKPVVNAQECDPSTLGLARKPRPALKRKPQTEVVVQLGPFTDGQITAPEMVRPLEGPTEWLIKPKTGEILPFDAGTPPEKDVIRKYITVGAQDDDVPEDLPKISEGYVVERVNQDPLPSMDEKVGENGKDTVRVVEKEGPAAVEYKDPPPTTVTENETPPPDVPPPVDEGEDCECPPPPQSPPVDEQEVCDKPVDAVDDCATTSKNYPVVIDVLDNDKLGCGDIEITEAHAENGTVEIKDGNLHYTPNEGFRGEDVITYSIGNDGYLTDTAHVYMTVESDNKYDHDSGDRCDDILNQNPYDERPLDDEKVTMKDYEYSSSPYKPDDSIFDRADDIVQDKLNEVQEFIQSKTGWSSSFGSSGFDSSASAPVEEPAAAS
ncbi:MAG: Ig-like domain-containing protein [Limnobacter sp.]|uniref:Ig-like domain-containing protein n=1 Tax=unclassified Limnobacter TaxID=2630203 RepID=UPI000CF46169|nr:Ig-like domain-containing protein [Limnobacter sp. SAORIC-690]PQJ25624.1 hypothetical protein BSZ31_12280 [Limnobacter sp. SAORIC-690]